MPNFICPNCGDRSESTERTAGFSSRAEGCKKCGFGFLFELLDDYYPAPNAAFFILDQEARVIGAGRGARELTGLGDLDVIGRPCERRARPRVRGGDDHIGTALEWGVRVLDKPVVVHAEGDRPEPAKADIFPAYDDDGGLLLVLTLTPHNDLTTRRRNLAILALVLVVLLGAAVAVIVTQADHARARPQGRRRADLRGPADAAGARGHAAGDRRRDRDDPQAHRRPRRLRARDPARGRDQISIGLPDVENADRAIEQVGTTAQLQFYDWEPNVLGRPRAGRTRIVGHRRPVRGGRGARRRPKPKAEANDIPPGSDEDLDRERPTARTTRPATATTSSARTASRSDRALRRAAATRTRQGAAPGAARTSCRRVERADPGGAREVAEGHRVRDPSSRRSASAARRRARR